MCVCMCTSVWNPRALVFCATFLGYVSFGPGPYFFISLGRISAPNERVKGACSLLNKCATASTSNPTPAILARDDVSEDLEVELPTRI